MQILDMGLLVHRVRWLKAHGSSVLKFKAHRFLGFQVQILFRHAAGVVYAFLGIEYSW